MLTFREITTERITSMATEIEARLRPPLSLFESGFASPRWWLRTSNALSNPEI